jgi:hypothetical protein
MLGFEAVNSLIGIAPASLIGKMVNRKMIERAKPNLR